MKVTENDIQDIIAKGFGQNIAEPQFALLGNFATKAIEVEGSDREGLVYVHGLGDDKTSSFPAFKAIEFRNVFGRAVEIVKTKQGYKIVGLAPEDATFTANVELSSQFPVLREQLMFAGIVPDEPASGSVQLMRAIVRVDDQHYYVNDVLSGDLTDGSTNDTGATAITLPSTEGQAKIVMIQVDPTTEAVSYKQTSTFNASFTLAQVTLPVPDSGNFLWGYVKLLKGTTSLTFANIINTPDVLTLSTGGNLGALALLDTVDTAQIDDDAITPAKVDETGDYTVNSVTMDYLRVYGTSDIIQSIIRAHSTQNANLTEWQNSSSTVLAYVDEAGKGGFEEVIVNENVRLTSATAGNLDLVDLSSNRAKLTVRTITLQTNSTSPHLYAQPRNAPHGSPTLYDHYLDDGTNTVHGNIGWRIYTGSWQDVGGGVALTNHSYQSGISGGTYTTNAGSYADMDATNMKPTLSIQTGTVRITFMAQFLETGSGTKTVDVDVYINATTYASGGTQLYSYGQLYDTAFAGFDIVITGLTAGNNTFALQFKSSDTNWTFENVSYVVQEIY